MAISAATGADVASGSGSALPPALTMLGDVTRIGGTGSTGLLSGASLAAALFTSQDRGR
jgi:hypothetical protein